ncbi:sigma factor-like helix-turn-helix DNA-binding protein [Rhodococcus sp. IEGM 1401]|uniref:sigma factor-like helix-turn-helix DNA-binding protein n=1 Tax=unclassified Rhodococcus (in: high G+C Gram-positive bacteria) TaxID=192944 RepID=UPI0022B57AF5|nr:MULTISPECIES: sigma factor-like helix-turn-helix DNA-binding protein [unclassified Rhodococcus (in: high G+C Gram-positive bacteria)]MCZ4564140.1 sigma factor-like helix-turn-helix DNA-binding protein [Rhodococcus sp. IEGM 1401]MDI9924270.1 sigma factor-like helix-turn-helix DNA-binding protein [Rhodococcus sp. IEGM 1372]MDV8036706.1 sigma factor-like helix-turn-helix DNA-binding protein [Rhodococcus sp. IEGM 1414]
MIDRQQARFDKITALIDAGLIADASDVLKRDKPLLTPAQHDRLRRRIDAAKLARQMRINDAKPKRQLVVGGTELSKPIEASTLQIESFKPLTAKSLQSLLSRAQDGKCPDDILNALKQLEPAELGLIRARFGMGGDAPQTHEELAKTTKLSLNRIRIIEERALGKITRHLSTLGALRPIDDLTQSYGYLLAPDPEPRVDDHIRAVPINPDKASATTISEPDVVAKIACGDSAQSTGGSTSEQVEQPSDASAASSFQGECDDLQELLDLLRPAPSQTQDVMTSTVVTEDSVAIYSVYKGIKTKARLYPTIGAVAILDGPLAGRDFATPSGAAKAVVAYYSPSVNPLRNGWAFWLVHDGSGRQIAMYKQT